MPDPAHRVIARIANEQRDPLRFVTDFRDQIRAVVKGINIAGPKNKRRNTTEASWRLKTATALTR